MDGKRTQKWPSTHAHTRSGLWEREKRQREMRLERFADWQKSNANFHQQSHVKKTSAAAFHSGWCWTTLDVRTKGKPGFPCFPDCSCHFIVKGLRLGYSLYKCILVTNVTSPGRPSGRWCLLMKETKIKTNKLDEVIFMPLPNWCRAMPREAICPLVSHQPNYSRIIMLLTLSDH